MIWLFAKSRHKVQCDASHTTYMNRFVCKHAYNWITAAVCTRASLSFFNTLKWKICCTISWAIVMQLMQSTLVYFQLANILDVILFKLWCSAQKRKKNRLSSLIAPKKNTNNNIAYTFSAKFNYCLFCFQYTLKICFNKQIECHFYCDKNLF